jgi:hypothetical protein
MISYLRLLLDSDLEDQQSPSLQESEEVFLLRLLILDQIWSENWKAGSLKIALVIQQLSPIM